MQAHSFFSGSIFFLLSAPLNNKSLDINKLRTSSITSILQGFVYCEPSAVSYLVVKQSESFLAPIHPLNLLKTDLSSLPRSSRIVLAHHVPMVLESPSHRNIVSRCTVLDLFNRIDPRIVQYVNAARNVKDGSGRIRLTRSSRKYTSFSVEDDCLLWVWPRTIWSKAPQVFGPTGPPKLYWRYIRCRDARQRQESAVPPHDGR